jgi:hypothetical protein
VVHALMKALAKVSYVNTALQIIQHMNNDMCLVEACRMAGTPRVSLMGALPPSNYPVTTGWGDKNK